MTGMNAAPDDDLEQDPFADFADLGDFYHVVDRDSSSSDVKAGDRLSCSELTDEEMAAMRDGTLPPDTLLHGLYGATVQADGSVEGGVCLVERFSAMPAGIIWPARVRTLERIIR